MQFRARVYKDKDGKTRAGQTIQLMRYSYDPVNKRGRQIMIGSFKVDDPNLAPEIEAKLTPEEKQEFAEWKKARSRAISHEKLAGILLSLEYVLTASCIALDVKAGTIGTPERIWALIDGLEKSMIKAGYSRPSKLRGRPTQQRVCDLTLFPKDDF